MRIRAIGLVLTAFSLLTGAAEVAVIIGAETSFLSADHANQLEDWLDEGPITLTNIYDYEYTGGITIIGTPFHAAADGQGRTYTVIRLNDIIEAGTGIIHTNTNEIIGGYNPQSWSSTGNYNLTPTDAERTAFIFNLTDGVKQDQKLDGDPSGHGGLGAYQTYNFSGYGPTFGGGHDIRLNGRQENGIFDGRARNYSYGTTYFSDNITSVSSSYEAYFSVKDIEVFTISPSVVDAPAPASLILWSLGGGLAFAGRHLRRRRSAETA